jgi:hypothetical protein
MNLRGTLCSGLLLGVSAVLLADGNTRPASKAENDFSLSILTALAKALPAPFPGFQAQGGSKLQPIGKVSPGTEKNPMQLYYSVTWTNPALAAQESRQKDEATARAAGVGRRTAP